jgi:O-antigen/teichoic acid export membrane protein
MSLRAMAVMRAEDEPAPPAGEQKKLRDQLITLIPAEAVVLYVAAIGAAAEAQEWVRWLLFGMVLAFTPVWVVASYWERKGGRTGVPVFEVVIGTVAFVAWTTTVPQGTFDDLGVPVWAGTIVVAVVSAALALAVRLKAVWAKKPNGPPPSPEPTPVPAG